MMAGLHGLRVLDISSGIAGPFCARLLADAGADVLRIGDGKDTRVGPQEAFLDRNKRGAVLDLGTARDRERFERLVARSDVIVESSRPGTMQALDLGFDHLAALNPGIIVASITGFGQTGPYRHYAADHLTISALGGWVYPFGETDREPLQIGFPVMYHMAGIYGAIAILAAVRGRRRDGRGQHIDVSSQEACLNMLSYPQVLEQFGCPPLKRNISAALQSFYVQAKGGWIALNHLTANQWETTCAMIGAPHLAEDASLLWNLDRKRAIVPEFLAAANEWARNLTPIEAFYAAQELQIPAGIPYTVQDLLECDQLLARDFFVRTTQPGLGEFVQPRAPFPSPSWRTDQRSEPVSEGAAGLSTTTADGGRRAPKDLLCGIRIADLSHFRSGPSGTSLLGGLGADVIKIEAIQRPDGFRYYNTARPHDPDFHELGSYFNAANTNKRGITLDLNAPRGKELFIELVGKSDVVVENFSPRVMRNLGFDYERLAQVNPRLIMVSMSCFGHTGPWRDFVGFGYVFDQVGGAAAVSGYEGGPPTHMMAASDVTSGIMAVYAILLALEERERTGRGQLIDMSQVETLAFLLGPEIIDYQLTGAIRPRMGNHDPQFAPHNVYPCRGEDEWVSISVETDEQWAVLASAIGKPQWAQDPRFATAPARKTHERTLDEALADWTRGRDKREVMTMMQALGIASGAVLKPMELLDDPHLEARQMHTRMTRAFAGEHRYPEFPIRFSDAVCGQRTPAPTLGQHNEEVLTGLLGISPGDLASLRESGVIGNRPAKA
ncbi:MAG: CoA transferase [Steroidobacteraceae bacterium]|jgi:crotonobetainyl-CoA:carnitine CoA-transferase CaiB-like acyl-CoA transferase